MVLYYKKVTTTNLEPDDSSAYISKHYDLPAVTQPTHEPTGPRAAPDRSLPGSQEIFEEFYKTPFSDKKELYYSLLEDNFNNLSLDDKLIIMYKTSIIRSNVTNNYILMCLAILVIIALKLYSK